jgi:hypothetical protein
MKPSLLIVLSFLALSLSAQEVRPADPRYTGDGQLIRPANYREWIFLSAGLGMTYGTAKPEAEQRFDNVFVTREAHKVFLKTGTWPDRTLFILELRASGSHASINKGGHYQEDVVAIEVHVKDESRLPNKWAFFTFKAGEPSAKPLPATSSCQTCHEAHGAVDETFVQFYPTLAPIARSKGTYREEPAK